MSKIEESLKNAPIIKKGEYNYVIHPSLPWRQWEYRLLRHFP